MAVQSDTSRIQYAGNNSTTTSYAVPFVFQENSHLKAIARTSAGVESVVTLTNHTGAGNVNGGTVRTAVAVPATSTLTIYREVPATQTTTYAEGGDFPAASHERALDKLTQIAQQLKRGVESSVRLGEATPINPLLVPNSANPHVLTTVNGNAPTWETVPSVSTTLNIPALTDTSTVGPSDELIVQQSGLPRRATANELLNGTATVTATGTTAGRTLKDRLADVVNVKDFGAVGDGVTDDTAAIQAAIDNVVARAAGGRIVIPSGTYKVNGALLIQKDGGTSTGTGVSILGHGKDNTRIMQASLTANTFEFRSMNFSGVSDLYIGHLTPASATAGYAVVLRNSPSLGSSGLHTWAKNIWINDAYNGILIESVAEARVRGVSMRGLRGTRGVVFTGSSGKASYGCYLEDVTSEGLNSGGNNANLDHFVFDSYAFSLQMSKCTALNGRYGLHVANSANQASSAPRWLFANGLELDYNGSFAAFINASQGVYIQNSWISSSQGNSGMYVGSGFEGEMAISNSRFVWNKFHGAVIEGGREILINNCIIGDNGSGGSVYDGVVISGGVDNFAITNCSIGDTLLISGTTQRNGVFITANNSSEFVIANNIFKSNTSAPISNNSTGVGLIVNNIGYNPVGASNVTVTTSPMIYTAGSTPETLYISGGTVASVAVGGQTLFSATNCTVRLGAGQQATITYSSTPAIKKYVD